MKQKTKQKDVQHDAFEIYKNLIALAASSPDATATCKFTNRIGVVLTVEINGGVPFFYIESDAVGYELTTSQLIKLLSNEVAL